MTRLVENEVGDKGQCQITKDLESHIKEFRSYFKSHGATVEDFKWVGWRSHGWVDILTGALQFVWKGCVCVWGATAG